MSNVKQVIVVRKDLKMTKGKMVAQGSHASLGVVLDMFKKECKKDGITTLSIDIEDGSYLDSWLNGIFTKVCVYVESENELELIYNDALNANIPATLITDRGLTMFHGIPTKTAVAIGPYDSNEIDKITGNLKLL